jgi:hypothetical protein
VQASEEVGRQSKKEQQKPVAKRAAQCHLRKSDCNGTRKSASGDRRHNLAYI